MMLWVRICQGLESDMSLTSSRSPSVAVALILEVVEPLGGGPLLEGVGFWELGSYSMNPISLCSLARLEM